MSFGKLEYRFLHLSKKRTGHEKRSFKESVANKRILTHAALSLAPQVSGEQCYFIGRMYFHLEQKVPSFRAVLSGNQLRLHFLGSLVTAVSSGPCCWLKACQPIGGAAGCLLTKPLVGLGIISPSR